MSEYENRPGASSYGNQETSPKQDNKEILEPDSNWWKIPPYELELINSLNSQPNDYEDNEPIFEKFNNKKEIKKNVIENKPKYKTNDHQKKTKQALTQVFW